MKFFKVDLMTVLAIVVAIGVVVTMTSQAGDRSMVSSEVLQASTHTVSAVLPVRH